MDQTIIENLQKTDVINEYIVNNMTLEELGKKYNVSHHIIREFLMISNVPRRRAVKRESLRPTPPIGKTFGQWTVVSKDIKVGGNRKLCWLCRCTCGRIEWKDSSSLLSGRTLACKSCCKKTYLDKDGMIPINTVLLHKYNQTKAGIVTRKNRGRRDPLTFNIECQDIVDLYESQHHKCALSGLSIEPNINIRLHDQNLSIDRIDSFKGYEKDNIQLVDKRINMMKGSLTDNEFIDLCVSVALYRGNCVKQNKI